MGKLKRSDQNGVIEADDIAACDGDQMLGVFANRHEAGEDVSEAGGPARNILRALKDRGADPKTFISAVVRDWSDFEALVSAKTDDCRWQDENPDLSFVTYFINPMITAVQEMTAAKVREAQSEIEWRVAREARQAKEEAESKSYREKAAADGKAAEEEEVRISAMTVAEFNALSYEEKAYVHDRMVRKLGMLPEALRVAVCAFVWEEEPAEQRLPTVVEREKTSSSQWSSHIRSSCRQVPLPYDPPP